MESDRLKFRGFVFTGILALVFFSLAAQMLNLQVWQQKTWSRLADKNRIRIVPIPAPRGTIYDRNGEVIASTRPVFTASIVYTNKEEIEGKTIPNLARILTWDHPSDYQATVEKIQKKIKLQRETVGLHQPVQVATDLDDATYTRIEERKSDLPGVNVEVQPLRDYVNKTVAAHILGYVREVSEADLSDPRFKGSYQPGDTIGKDGLERQYEEALRGKKGGKEVEVDWLGRYLKDLYLDSPVPGKDLYLTIDLELQRAAEEALVKRMKEIRGLEPDERGVKPTADAGTVVVLDVRTGEVLAMASYPTYDPNQFVTGKIDLKALQKALRPFLNRAISGTYPPGSTYKLVTASAGLEEGIINPAEVIFSGDRSPLFHHPREWKRGGLGPVNLVRAIALSSDIYFYEMGYRIGPDLLAKWARNYGFASPTGIDLPGEAKGTIPIKASYGEEWYPGEILSLAIGQGRNTVTAVQLADYVEAVANGGTIYKPHLVREIRGPRGEAVTVVKPEALRKVPISPRTVDLLHQGMHGVVSEGGTTNAFYYPTRFPIPVAGKTGSVERGRPQDRLPDNGLFISYAPYDHPEIAVAVVIEGSGGGARTSPVARWIMEKYFEEQGMIKPVASGNQNGPNR
ncbi:MAG: penicillin-binding protein 2 [Firmicutes bacterium]|nr:penicillin-binding protein 2 [Bacillota bacterium]